MTRIAIRTAFLLAATCFPLVGTAQSTLADSESVDAFFEKYVKLMANYDSKLADLYWDQAAIYPAELSADGTTVKSFRMTGAQYKALLPRVLPVARRMGELDVFTNVRITTEGSKARITADRYSSLKCYTDKHFSLRVERQSDGSYLIIEERGRSQEKSDC